ncbi:hypothetical protein P3W45_001768 [Vairimorpha bombi]
MEIYSFINKCTKKLEFLVISTVVSFYMLSIYDTILSSHKYFNCSQIQGLCKKCNRIVGSRTVHCELCNKCYYKRDHHCIITGKNEGCVVLKMSVNKFVL